MPASLERVRATMNVEETSRKKGLRLTLRIVAYDNGMIEVDGVPINEGSARHGQAYDPTDGWTSAIEVAIVTINEFRRQATRRTVARP